MMIWAIKRITYNNKSQKEFFNHSSNGSQLPIQQITNARKSSSSIPAIPIIPYKFEFLRILIKISLILVKKKTPNKQTIKHMIIELWACLSTNIKK